MSGSRAELANIISEHIVREMRTDIKKIMQSDTRRAMLPAVAKENLHKIIGEKDD